MMHYKMTKEKTTLHIQHKLHHLNVPILKLCQIMLTEIEFLVSEILTEVTGHQHPNGDVNQRANFGEAIIERNKIQPLKNTNTNLRIRSRTTQFEFPLLTYGVHTTPGLPTFMPFIAGDTFKKQEYNTTLMYFNDILFKYYFH